LRFTDSLWQEVQPIYQAILEHPFNQELAQGSLPREKFAFYLQQDALYLADFGRALALMGSRATSPERMLDFVKFAETAVVVERALHEEYFRFFEISQPATRQSPSCFAYTNFVLATTAHRTYEEGVACLLPCFWVYREVGQYVHRVAAAGNPYQKWIDTYASPQFAAVVDKAIALCEETAQATTAAVRQAMAEAFAASTRLEWMFWDSAYRMEAWLP